jgi:hypothetical protein
MCDFPKFYIEITHLITELVPALKSIGIQPDHAMT